MPRSSARLVVVGCLAMAGCRVGYDVLPGASDDASPRRDARIELDAEPPPIDSDVPRDAEPPPPPDAPSTDAPGMDARRPDAATPDAMTPDADAPDTGPPSDDAGPDAAPPIDGGPCGAPPTAMDYCAEVPSLAAPPVIDGSLDCGLALQEVIPRGWTGAEPIPAGTVARFAYAWRPDGVYAFVDVTDPRRMPPRASDDVYCGAGAEIHVDADGRYPSSPFYDDPGTRQFIAAAPADDTTPSTRGEVYWTDATTHDLGRWTTRFVVTPRAGGYTLEAFVNAADLGLATWSLASGQDIGIDVAVNVSVEPSETVDCGRRLGQYFLGIWEGGGTDTWCHGLPFCDTRAFCNPTLVD